MRMRKKKHRDERIAECTAMMQSEPFPKGKWQQVFDSSNPLFVEIGCGKGNFITQTAQMMPDVNFVAIEKCSDVALLAMEKAMAAGIKNIKFICGNADYLDEIFAPGECSRIYINFCDPWHKKKHAKRRLTHRNYINKYKALLEPVHGEIHFKTDNKNLFEFSLNEFCGEKIMLKNITLDLHNSDFEGNVMTEYEQLFSERGMPIYRLEAQF